VQASAPAVHTGPCLFRTSCNLEINLLSTFANNADVSDESCS
jgi:hypothetical protein